MMNKLNEYFESYVKIIRIQIGYRQTVETCIGEEALLLAQFIRSILKIWTTRTRKYASK
jgi:hypothetical protein